MRFRAIRTFLAIVICLACCAPSFAGWKAGTAKTMITPEKFMWMSGYGGRDKPADGKLTDLWAKALVLEDDRGSRAVLVTLELVGIDRGISQRVCQKLMEQYGLKREQIALSCSHTHSGPVVGDNLRSMYFYDDAQDKLVKEYTAVLEGKIVAVVGEALQNIAPAKLTWGQGQAGFAVNRRNNPEADVPKLREAGQLKGPVDHDLPLLVVRDEKGALRAIVGGYACHATVLNLYQWTGDWPGYAMIELEKRHPEAQAMVWIGCGADQNPLPRRQVELAQHYGKVLADAMDAALMTATTPIEGELRTSYAEIPLALAKIPTREELERDVKHQDRYQAARAKHLLATLERDGSLSPTYPYPVEAWQLGNGPTLVTLGGEVVVDYSLRLKTELGAKNTWVMGYANDVMAYIPSRRVLVEGGYEGASAMIYYGLPSPWTIEVEGSIVDQVHRAVDQVRTGGSARYRDHSNLLVYLDAENREHPVKTPEDWQRRRNDILTGMQQAMGPLPDRSKLVPLDLQETARQQGSGYTRRTITFTIEPGDKLTAYLYVPDGLAAGERRPAMLALHPTGPQGKGIVAGEGPRPNRGYAVELAERGYVVLAPDYPSFGDSSNYDFKNDRYDSGSMKGVFNHMRCVDVLQAREDVDPERIGTVGHSLGGHNSMFVAAFDPRIKVTVSSCGWCPFPDYYGGKIAGWTSDRYMPRLRDVYNLDAGRVPFDFYEVVAALAPRAFYSCSPKRDSNFDVAGVEKCIPKSRAVYQLLGADDRLVVEYPDCEHDFPPESRDAAYAFIDRILNYQKK